MLSNSQVLGSLWSCLIKRVPSSLERLSYWLDQMTAAVFCARLSLWFIPKKSDPKIKRAIFIHFVYIMSFWVLIINSFGWMEKNLSHFFSFTWWNYRGRESTFPDTSSKRLLRSCPSRVCVSVCVCVCVCVRARVCVCSRERERERVMLIYVSNRSPIYIFTQTNPTTCLFLVNN